MPATPGRVRLEPAMVRLSISLALVAVFVACEAASPPTPAARPDIVLAPDSKVSRGVVPRDSTLEAMLLEQGLQADVVHGVIAAVKAVFDPRRLRSLQPFALEQSLDGALRLFEYEIDASSFLRVRSVLEDASRLEAEVVPIPVTVVPASVTGAIDDDAPSLFQSIDAAGEQPDLAVAMAQIFGGEIDFNTELQPGDRYTVAFERLEREGRRSSYGVITAAEFQNDGRVLRAIRFTPKGGQPGYYDPDGRSLRRFFLRSPLKFEPRVTSGFSARRMHPVLHTARAHRGVDYGAPMGSEVVSVASGRVVSVTSDATNGRMVRVRHASGYVSYYLHLSAFAAGNPRRRRRRAGADDRSRRSERPGDGSAPALRASKERRVRQSTARTQEHAARRSGPGVRTRRLPHRTREGAWPSLSRPAIPTAHPPARPPPNRRSL